MTKHATHPKSAAQIRHELEQKIQTVKKPVVVFDLDGTLFNVSHRTLEILQRFSQQKDLTENFPSETALLKKLTLTHVKYNVEGTLNELGISRYSEHSAHFMQLVEKFWFRHFFTDELVLFDEPYEGAHDCVHWFKTQGVHIAYLSGRDVPNMSAGTIGSLEKHGLPHRGHDVSLLLKPAYGQDDLLFKKQALETIRGLGDVVATFDNEPANVALFLEEFPQALAFHFNSSYARWVELKGSHLRTIKSFREFI